MTSGESLEDMASLTLARKQLEECIKVFPVLGIDTEAGGKILAVIALDAAGGCNFKDYPCA